MRRLSLALALGLAALPAHATNGLRMTGFGPVNASMGGAGVAAAVDTSALVLNPATLADLDGRVDFGAAYFPTTVSYSATNNYLNPALPPQLQQLGGLIVNKPNVSITSDFPAVPLPNIGLVIPLAKDWRLGVGMAALAGVGVDYAANLFSSTVQTTYFNFRFPIGVSWQVLDMLSVGATANGSWALMGYTFGASLGLPPHPLTSSFGAGFSLGAKVKALPFLSFGAAYESPTWFKPFKYNIGCANPGGAVPPNTFPQCGPLGVPGGREELELNLPWSGALGVEAELLDGTLVLAGDAQFIAWSTTLGKGQPAFVNGSATITSESFPFSANWSDQWVYKIGAQVKATDWLKIRAGFNYGKNPVDPNRALEAIAFPAIDESHVTFGAGLQVSKAIAINLGSVVGFKHTVSGTGNLPDLSALAGQPPNTLPPATLSYSTSVSGYTIEAGVSVTY